MNDEENSDWVIGPGKCVTIIGLPVQEIVVSFDCSKGKEDFKSSLASKTVLPRRSGGQYRTTERPRIFSVGSGPLQDTSHSNLSNAFNCSKFPSERHKHREKARLCCRRYPSYLILR